MKLLFITQVVDTQDAPLGFVHDWIVALAARFATIEVICLYEGTHSLPANVRVHSLGKERGRQSAFAYAIRFMRLIWLLRRDYDRVFVHMNQEYLLLAGWFWKLLGKRAYLWRNHYAGSWLTDLAAFWCTNVFCTSRRSYTARYPKTLLMPVGIDTERFSANRAIERTPLSILFLARMAPSKRPDLLLNALGILKEKGIPFIASLYGSALPEHEAYYASLKELARTLGIADSVTFHSGVPNRETPAIYAAHEVFVNCSPSGMYDKTLFEAAASGCAVLAASEDFVELAGQEYGFTDAGELAARLEVFLEGAREAKESTRRHMRELAEKQALPLVIATLADTMQHV